MTRLFAGTPFDRPVTCERCGQVVSACQCPPVTTGPALQRSPQQQTARLALEKRKKGKVVTVIRGLSAADNDLTALTARFKATCGAGGTLDSEVIEIQGDHVDRLKGVLQELGYRIRG